MVAEGYDLGGVRLSAAFLTGGLFSYDGVHPTAMGYGIIADEFVQAINARYGGSIPRVKLGKLLRTGAATTAPVTAAEATIARAHRALRRQLALDARPAHRRRSSRSWPRRPASPTDDGGARRPRAPRRRDRPEP